MLLFLTANKANGREGKVFCARSDDACRSWKLQSFVDDVEPVDEQIMPASLRLPDGSLLVATRCCGDGRGGRHPTRQWTDIYHTVDEGRSFAHISRPIDEASKAHGNPPTLTLLPDQSGIVLAYGHREPPYGIRYKVGSLDGKQWGSEMVLRSDAGCSDLGYLRTVLRPGGSLLSVYYYNDSPNGDRYIAATNFVPQHRVSIDSDERPRM